MPALVLFCAMPFVPPPLALLLGAGTGLCVGHPYAEVTRAWTPRILALAVIALGAEVDLMDVGRVGAEGALLTLITIGLCLGLGALLTRALGVAPRVGLLIAVGTAICGGSAIAAVAPVVRAKDHETSIALATVFVLNAVALAVLPFIGRAAGLDADAFGTYAALAVHDTSSVVGAAMSFGERAVDVATTVKLARATWIVPVTFIASAWLSKKSGVPAERGDRPWFILGFLGCATLFTFVPALAPVQSVLGFVARRAMVVTLFLVGAGLSRDALVRAGARPLLLGAALWTVIALASLALVRP